MALSESVRDETPGCAIEDDRVSDYTGEPRYGFAPAPLQMLGGARLHLGRRIITRFRPGKSLQLLAYLALRPGVNHERTFLADLLWPDAPPETGRARLSVALTFLRGLLEHSEAPDTVLTAERATIRLSPGRIHTDVGDFERILREAEREASRPGAPVAGRLRLLGDALRLYGGDLLPGLTDEWIEAERARLAALQDNALAEWESLTRRRPPQPAAHRQTTDDAPTPMAPTLPHSATGKAALPRPHSRLVGRNTELQALRGFSKARARLVTLVGPGGVGKTHLSLEAASGETDLPVVWVPLADITQPADLPLALADALRLPAGDRRAVSGAVTHALNAVPSLVLLDNAEHLREGVADLVAGLLDAAPESSFWVTSREPLNVVGERIFPVSPLSLPPEGADEPETVEASSACALFLERAREARPDFTITPRNAGAIARLCHRLDGIPLALELAAARVQTTSVSHILESLQSGAGALPAKGKRRGLSARHQSLHATLAWSVNLLLPSLARFLFALSVFHGGWTVEAAEAVTGDTLAADHLAELVTASLVVAVEQWNGRVRYNLLETVRDFAAQELDETAQAEFRERHRAYFTEMADQSFDGLWDCGREHQVKAFAEVNNLLTALETAQQGEATEYLRLAGAAGPCLHRHRDLAATHLQQALTHSPPVDSWLRARALFVLNSCDAAYGATEVGQDAFREAILMARRLKEPRILARFLAGDVDNEQALDESVRLLLAHGTPSEQAQAFLGQAVGTWRQGAPEVAEARFAEAHRLSRMVGVTAWPSLLTEWSYFLLWRGDMRRAAMFQQTAVDTLVNMGHDLEGYVTDHPRWMLAFTLIALGQYEAARTHADIVIANRRNLPPSLVTVTPRRVAALACIGQQDYDNAEIYLNRAAADLAVVDPRFGVARIGAVQAELALARGDIRGAFARAEEAFARAHEEIGYPALPDAPFWNSAHVVGARSALAQAETYSGLWDAAHRGFSDALRFRDRVGLYYGAFLEIEGLAACRREAGDATNAARLFAASETLRLRAETPPFPHQARELAARVAPLRTDASLKAAWREGQNFSLAEAIALALSE